MMTNNSNINTGRIRIFEERASDREQQDSRWVYLERLPDNGWRVHEDNMGATAKRMFGRDETEWWINIQDTDALAFFAFIAEQAFKGGKPMVLVDLKRLLTEKGIPFESGTWTGGD